METKIQELEANIAKIGRYKNLQDLSKQKDLFDKTKKRELKKIQKNLSERIFQKLRIIHSINREFEQENNLSEDIQKLIDNHFKSLDKLLEGIDIKKELEKFK